MMDLFILFFEFFKIGLFSVGGGLATLPFLYRLADKYSWFSVDQIPDMIAISESTPGPLGVNMATYTGFQHSGVLGSICATAGLIFPSVVIIICVSKFLEKFRSGEYPVLLTSKVLNEGVDVPEASIGIVVSGSGSTREHVQRLGRILRAKEGKQAVLYELVSDGTSEMSVSFRRRQHRAYGNYQYNEAPVKEMPEKDLSGEEK